MPQDALATLDDLIHDGKRVDVIPQDRISQVHALAGARRAQDLDPAVLRKELRERRIYGAVTEQRYRTVMRRLQRDARTMTQETGSNYLYLTIGTLVHPKSSGGEAHAPLFLLPVRIEGGAGARPYHLVVDGTEVATPNHCLVEWLRVKHRVQIPELENPPQDEHGLDIPLTLTAIRKRLVENRLNYRVEETASLRLLQFSTFQMWRDLTDHWSTFMENPVVRHLVEQPGTNFLDPVGSDLTPRHRRSRPAPAHPRRRLTDAGGGHGRAGPIVRAGGAAGHGQVADDHQPARPGDRRPSGRCCSWPRSRPLSRW